MCSTDRKRERGREGEEERDVIRKNMKKKTLNFLGFSIKCVASSFCNWFSVKLESLISVAESRTTNSSSFYCIWMSKQIRLRTLEFDTRCVTLSFSLLFFFSPHSLFYDMKRAVWRSFRHLARGFAHLFILQIRLCGGFSFSIANFLLLSFIQNCVSQWFLARIEGPHSVCGG